MMIGGTTYALLLYGSLVVAGIALIAAIAMREAREKQPDVPAAAIHSARARIMTAVFRWLPAALVIGGCAAAYELHHNASSVWLVVDRDGAPSVSSRRYFGDPSASYPSAPDGSDRDGLVGYDAWVINESTRPLRLELKSYGRNALGPTRPDHVPPGTAMRVHDIDDVGPDHPPPNEIEVEGLEARFGVGTRQWLTWDR